MCFACIFENVMFFFLQFADDKAMITWYFCSADINESVLNFLAAEYVVDLIILCYYFCQIFGMNSFVFPWSYVSSFVLKGRVADEKVIIAQKSTRCCPLLFPTPRVKLPMQLSLACFLFFFSTVKFQSPVKNTSDLFLRWLRAVLTSLRRLSSTETLSLTSWFVGANALMMLIICLGSGMNSRLMVVFGIGRHLYDLNFQTDSVFEFWRCFFDVVCALFGGELLDL